MINFPNSPTLNEVFTSGDNSWKWNGFAWNLIVLPTNNIIRTIITGATYSVSGTDKFIGIQSTSTTPITITLPLASSLEAGRYYEFKDEGNNASVNNITWIRSGGDLIENDQTAIVGATNGMSLIFYSDGISKWYIK